MCWEISKPASRTHKGGRRQASSKSESSSWSGLQETLLKYLLLSNKRPTTHPKTSQGAADVFLLSDPCGWKEHTGHPCYIQGKGPGGDTPTQSHMELYAWLQAGPAESPRLPTI